MSRYLEMLSLFGVAGAHPGGLAFTKTVLQKAALPSNLPILDAGCGTGQTAAYLGHLLYPVTVIDKDPVMLEKAKKRFASEGLSIPAYLANLEELPFSSETFSAVLSESVLSFSHIPSSLPDIYRVLKPGGMLIGIEAALKKPLSGAEKKKMTDFYGFTELFDEAEWKQTMMQYGFRKTETIDLHQENTDHEPTTEMDLSLSIPPIYYDTLQAHYELMQTYSEYMGHCVFFAYK
ncbi:class I SAM-dependent methyltransferase [Bacillus atrophaeus]|uniref:class I SAM-dependent methyltransferase n=1 Tax=Bacillus atrophaeus TaxID=1452 RepID=UPI000B926B4F|nr:class I SAM-dependent methyltransferase [Bacillus atrophaeus]ASS71432.1 SAM-dependent methyltransferase [Bacillus atrophaeus]PSA93400.1 class I SAM-dependent methyltransferase [Bacillus atrophaeus]